MLALVLAGFLSLATGAALPPRSGHATLESRSSPPAHWAPSHRPARTASLPLRIGLAQSNTHLLEEHLLAVSDPDSPSYGEHWTPAQVQAEFAPSAASKDAVLAWLEGEGVGRGRVRMSKSGAWVEVRVSVEEAEALMGAEYWVYRHGPTGKEHIGASSLTLLNL